MVPRDMARKNRPALLVRGDLMMDDQIQDGDIRFFPRGQGDPPAVDRSRDGADPAAPWGDPDPRDRPECGANGGLSPALACRPDDTELPQSERSAHLRVPLT
ncbi:hypothetical protein G3480_24095 [Thiorhodococcus mannitoliphagus]|uniref:Uncharacterized protein n=1 Tax=Thiorhodococcus mannitoliphagus TaxID=329406 RepID=A0A6P1E0B9_9GAMM|nr:hypothetical protein [Thiorhodococcus mannitoliphagus]NEX23339.1 hypothetical protein [Thiorhodococcus mannitoliphagus]